MGFALACAPSNPNNEAPTTIPSSRQGIRRFNFNTEPEIDKALRQLGSGTVAVNEITFVDLTGDGIEEAVVPVSSEGTVGNIAYLVLTLKKDVPSVILT